MAASIAITALRLQEKTCETRNSVPLRNSQNGQMDREAIRKGLQKPGKTQRGLAEALGVDPAAVNRLLKGDRKLQVHEVPKVQAYLDSPDSGPAYRESRNHGTGAVKEASNTGQLRLPVLGMAECGSPDGWNIWNGDVIDTIPMPSNLAGVPGAYAVFINGVSMAPRFTPGEVANIHPYKPVTPGCYVLVQKKPNGPGEAPLAVIKQLVRRSGTKITLAQLNPAKTFEIKAEEVVSIHRVVGSQEA